MREVAYGRRPADVDGEVTEPVVEPEAVEPEPEPVEEPA